MKTFKESLDTAVFTTRFVVERLSPILFVSHDEDGSWQFHGEDQEISENDFRLITLREIIEMDKTILELADMPEGFEAMRKAPGTDWKILNNS